MCYDLGAFCDLEGLFRAFRVPLLVKFVYSYGVFNIFIYSLLIILKGDPPKRRLTPFITVANMASSNQVFPLVRVVNNYSNERVFLSWSIE